MHELITSDLCDIDFDLSLSRGRSKNNRRKDKSCNNGRAAHDHAPFRGRAKTSLPDRALIIDTSLKGHHVQPAFRGHRALTVGRDFPTSWVLFICAKNLLVETKAPQAPAPKRLSD